MNIFVTWINSTTVHRWTFHQEPVFIDGMLNSTEVVVHSKTNFVNVVKKSCCSGNHWCRVPTDIARSSCEIETTLDISGTSIHSILHELLTVKKICLRWIPHNFSIAQKRLVSIGRKKCSKNTIAVLRNTSIKSWQVMNRGFTRMSFKMSQIQQKLLAHEVFCAPNATILLVYIPAKIKMSFICKGDFFCHNRHLL